MDKFKLVLGSTLALLASSSFAAIDYAAGVTAATTEVNAAITAAIPVGVLVLAATVGWKLFKRFAKG